MIRIFGTVLAGLLGLAFGSFMNVCLSRWPEGESVVRPRSHCRRCGRSLAWWENVPLLSWMALRGRCRGCGSPIGARYVLVEAAVGGTWAIATWYALRCILGSATAESEAYRCLFALVAKLAFCWLLVCLAGLDAEHLWLPDWLTLPGAVAGFAASVAISIFAPPSPIHDTGSGTAAQIALRRLLSIFIAAGLILLIRGVYWLVRRREGIGLGDAKLMATLAAWLGLQGALLAFALGVALGAGVAVGMLAVPASRDSSQRWAASKLPLGTFLCIGGIVSSLWGQQIVGAYLRWAGW
jgi:leader peptidase (prepilin peptidase)/N-methyltransferase